MTPDTHSATLSRPSTRWRTVAFVEHTMGMAVSLHLRVLEVEHARRADELSDVARRAFAALHRADDVFSTYRADSQLMRIRRGRLTEVDADPWYAEVHAACDEASAVTGGLFTTDLVGPDGSRGYDPTGLVKGFAVERAAEVLRRTPRIIFCLNAGGDLACGRGVRPHPGIERVWRVGISDPQDAARIVATIELEQGALATSGTAQRGDHIVDPRVRQDGARSPGSPRARGCGASSVTVVGPDLVWADVWATACFLDPDALAFSRMAASYRVAHLEP